MSLILRAIQNPKRAFRRLLLNNKADEKVNWFIDRLLSSRAKAAIDLSDESDCIELAEIKRHAFSRTDISDHLVSLFAETLSLRPELIVELGVRDGQSTFAFERAARLCGAALVSVDILPVEVRSLYSKWYFIQEDDLTLAQHFPAWCIEHGLHSQIDLLFIDTSHHYEHTCQEIAAWFPLLAPHAKVIFHDSDMRLIFSRRDHSLGIGWDNRRGVISAIEAYLGTSYNEKGAFSDLHKGWYVRHWPQSCGFTVLERLWQE